MPKSLTHALSLLLLVIMMTNLGAWGVNSAKLAHDFEHAMHPEIVMLDHQHTHQHISVDTDLDDDDDANIGNAVEHRILHAIDHLQFFADARLYSESALILLTLAPWYFTERALPLASISPPFRPPRSALPA